jgi:hypothetical protein
MRGLFGLGANGWLLDQTAPKGGSRAARPGHRAGPDDSAKALVEADARAGHTPPPDIGERVSRALLGYLQTA